MKIVITGGHHSSALPVIKKLKEAHPNIEIHWVGHRHSLQGDKNDTLEYKEITSLNIPFYELKAGKFYKTYNPVKLLKIPMGFVRAFFMLLKIKPDVILSFGGYLAVPVVISGWFLGIKSITHEQTLVVGYANKLISKFAKKVLISWEESKKYFPIKKVVLVGLPLREAIKTAHSDVFNPKNNFPTVYITAGKTGSHIINVVIRDCLAEILGFCNVIHQCGDNSVYNDFDELSDLYSNIAPLCEGEYFVRKFVLEDEIGEAFNEASLIVSRAGAHTCGEILLLQKPSVLIPIPWVSHNEQNLNAQNLKNLGLATILDQNDLSPQLLVDTIKNVLFNIDEFKLKDLSAQKLLDQDSAQIIMDETLKIAKKKK